MRRLIYVPTFYSKKGEDAPIVKEFWQKIEESPALSSLDYSKVRLYVDSLSLERKPIGLFKGRALKKRLQQIDSKEYQLALKMVEKGAQLEETENPIHVRRLVELAQWMGEIELGMRIKGLNETRPEDLEVAYHKFDQLTEERDRYIAERISNTLKEGEIGVLIIGAAHKVKPYLPEDIEVEVINEGDRELKIVLESSQTSREGVLRESQRLLSRENRG